MNKIYTTVWCESRQQWVVTSELARSSGRPKLAPKKSALALLLGAMLLPSGPAMAVNYVGETLTSSTQNISSDDTATDTTINSGGTQNISSGGTATDTTINSGGTQNISSGGTATDTTINSGGIQNVSNGGTVIDTTISGGLQNIASGGTAIGTTINSGSQSVWGDSTATDTTINSGGRQGVYGGTVADTTINSGGSQHVSGVGTATNTTINGGLQYVSSGGTATSTTINSGGYQMVSNNGTATSTTVNSGGRQDVNSGGTATSTTINSGGSQNVASDSTATAITVNGGWQYVSGTATDTTINSGGMQQVFRDGGTATNTTINNGYQYVSGTATSTTINSGGQQFVSNGGIATDTTINSGGQQFVSNGGIATDTTINSGGQQFVSNGGIATDTTINIGGNQYVFGGTATSSILNYGGMQHINGGGSASDTTIYNEGMQWIYSGGSAAGTTINSGGLQLVSSGGIATDTTINGGQSWLLTGALADGKTQINTGGELLMEAGSVAADVNITGGTLSVIDLSDATAYAPAQIDNLTMAGGNVSFLGNSGGDFATLNISELNGHGNFLFNTSLAERNANFVTIEQGRGNFGIGVTDSGKEITGHTDLTVNLIHDQGGEIEFEMVTASGRSTRAIDGGTYMYTLFSQQGKDDLNDGNVWYLGAMTDEPGEGGNGEKPMTTPATDAVLAMATAGLNVMRSELDSLRVYRNSQDSDRKQGDGNVWGHYLGKKSAIDNSNGAAYKLHQNGFELGGDIVTGFDTGHLVTGGFVTLSNNQVNHERGGKSKIDSYGLGAYATWYDNSGFYVDGALKANRLENNLNARMTNGDSTSGKWHQYAISTALEGGYTFKPMDNMTIEPFVRSTATHINNANVTLSNGMKAETGKARSLTAEAGTRLGTQFALGSTQFAPYFSASVEQEFAKSNTTLINGINSFDNNLNGTSGKYAAGLSAQLTKGTTVYGEMSYRQGSHIEEPIQGVAGIRVSF
ncbi:autotransporter outer membrane beta-barrel domain-containing protein [Kluyvera sp. STS39-E]|uniref:autotransporter outer membrane beta-barrel domain-containing protein n=1 Tax=Kluyvera sp. STS39-E TaxID=3234748 RepID=UPI0034C6C69C